MYVVLFCIEELFFVSSTIMLHWKSNYIKDYLPNSYIEFEDYIFIKF